MFTDNFFAGLIGDVVTTAVVALVTALAGLFLTPLSAIAQQLLASLTGGS